MAVRFLQRLALFLARRSLRMRTIFLIHTILVLTALPFVTSLPLNKPRPCQPLQSVRQALSNHLHLLFTLHRSITPTLSRQNQIDPSITPQQCPRLILASPHPRPAPPPPPSRRLMHVRLTSKTLKRCASSARAHTVAS